MRSRGNVLFIILLVVILFAALSYAVTQSVRGGGNDASSEQARALAAQIIQSAVLTQNTLNRFMLMNNLNVGQIDMYKTGFTRSGNITDCTTASCNLFDPAGGNIPAPILPQAASDAALCAAGGGVCTSAGEGMPLFMIMSVDGVGTDAPELVMATTAVTGAVCDAVNIIMGLANKGDTRLTQAQGGQPTDWVNYTGAVYPLPTTTPGKLGSSDSRIKGAHTFCARIAVGSTQNYFYQVLYVQ